MNYQQIRHQYPALPLAILQRFGHDPITNKPLVCDGKLGPVTQRATYLPVDKVAHPVALNGLQEVLQGSCEVGGNNRGAWVNKYFRLTNRASVTIDRGAWCAAFVTWLLNTHKPFPACWGALRTVKNYCNTVTIDKVKDGDLISWRSLTRPAPAGHIALVVYVDNECIWTVEGNVDLTPGLDGVAFRRLDRNGKRSDGSLPHQIGRPIQDR